MRVSSLKRKKFLDCFCVFCAQMYSQRTMPVALWRTVLLLCFLGLCACLEEECVLGIIGRPASLPCFYPKLLTFVNFSIEWRRDDEVVLRSEWGHDGNVEERRINSATISADAALSGNFSLELATVEPEENKTYYSLFIISEANQSAALCTVCLRIAASFSSPQLHRKDATRGDETTFSCHSSGGFPEPGVYWLINDTQDPPEGSVTTLTESIGDSRLYNITSHLTVNISKDSSVSCIVENRSMNETLTSTSYGVKGGQVVASRASEAMWIFSTGLCVVVGIMVLAGVAYQIHLDRISKKKKKEYEHSYRGYKRRCPYMEETEEMRSEPKETDV